MKYVFQCWVLIASALSSASSLALVIQDVPNIVRKYNRDVLASAKDVEGASSGHDAAVSRYYPKIELKSSYTRLDKDIALDIGPKRIERDILGGSLQIAIEVDPPPVTIQEKNIYNAHFSVVQPLYTGGRITAGVDAATAQVSEAKLQQNVVTDEKTQDALNRYFQVILAHKVIEALKRVDEDLSRMEAIATSLVKTGMAARFSTLQIHVARAELKARMVEADAKKKLADLAFKTITGFSNTANINYESQLKRVPLKNDLDTFKAQALQRRHELPLLEAKAEQLRALKSVQTGGMLPNIYAFGKHELIKDELTILQPVWAIGIGIDIPLTAGLTQMPERQRVTQMQQKIDIYKQKAQYEIPLQVESFHASCLALSESLIAVESGLDVAKEAQRLAGVRFKSGAGSSMEVLKASADREALEVKSLMLLEEYNRNVIALHHAAGNVAGYLRAYAQVENHRGAH